jgi:hypothetical protein
LPKSQFCKLIDPVPNFWQRQQELQPEITNGVLLPSLWCPAGDLFQVIGAKRRFIFPRKTIAPTNTCYGKGLRL